MSTGIWFMYIRRVEITTHRCARSKPRWMMQSPSASTGRMITLRWSILPSVMQTMCFCMVTTSQRLVTLGCRCSTVGGKQWPQNPAWTLYFRSMDLESISIRKRVSGLYQLTVEMLCLMRVWFWIESLYLVPVRELSIKYPTAPQIGYISFIGGRKRTPHNLHSND